MADKPIIFSAPMVRALLDGRKTQTRRVLKPQPKVLKNGIWYRPYPVLRPLQWAYLHGDRIAGFADTRYAPGDRLWVREAFIGPYAYEVNEYPPRDWGNKPIWFPADGPVPDKFAGQFWPRARPSIHMPRWASRLTLTVTDVRVQRLQEISEADAWAEGCKPGELNDRGEPFPAEEPHPKCGWVGWDCARDWYADLWDSLHGPDAWDANPWVAAYTFTVQHGNIDCLPAPLGVEQRPQANRSIRRKTTSMAAKGGA